MFFPTLPFLAWLRALERSSSTANSSATHSPKPRRRKRPCRSWACRTSEACDLSLPTQLLAHHLSRRYVSSPDSLRSRIAMVRSLTSGEPFWIRGDVMKLFRSKRWFPTFLCKRFSKTMCLIILVWVAKVLCTNKVCSYNGKKTFSVCVTW